MAIRIADVEGLASLSMRRVTTELDITTMSIYRYVPGVDELLELMAEPGLELDLDSLFEFDPRELLDGLAAFIER